MGDVYRAHDTTLGREVALKMLPASVSSPGGWPDDRMARFRREAQTLASVNHPNIAAIHGLEQVDDLDALVLEFVEGPTVADRIARGPVPIDEALAIARQMATGLEAAHELGIVHRDLKPANVKVRPDGTVKVLDFGLAKYARPPAAASDVTTANPAITSPSLLQHGVLLGTPAYMSPEQARGREADRRSDIWALGAVLYELLCGRRAFEGTEVSDVLAAVLRADIDWSRLPAATPADVRHLVARCLDRDPMRRLRDIGEARIALEDAARLPSTTGRGEPASVPRAPWRRLVSPVVAAAITGAGVAVALWPTGRATDLPVTRFALSLPADRSLLLDPQSRDLVLTPDGTRVIYKGGPRADQSQLFTYAFDQLEPQLLTGVGLPKGPIASPDGQWVVFFEPGIGGPGPAVKKVAIAGGPSVEISRLDGPSRGASWGDDNTIVAASGSPSTGLLRISPEGGTPVVLTRPNREQGENDHLWPVVLPGSRSVLFTVTSLTGGLDAARVAVLDVASGTWKTVIRNASQAHYVSTGHLVYHAGNALWAIAFDARRLETMGSATAVVPQVVTLPTGAAEFDVARDGTLAYVASGGASASPRRLVWVDRQGREELIDAPPRPYSRVRVSPDGTQIALESDDGDQDIWVWHITRHTLTRVTTDPGLDESPVWMPDGRRLIFTSQRGGVLGSLFWQAADGTGDAERLTDSSFIQRATAVLPGGRAVVFSEGNELKTLTLDPPRTINTLVPRTPGDGTVSPDGRWLAYTAIDSGVPHVYVTPLASAGAGRTQVTPVGGSQPRWALSGRELYYTGFDGVLMSVPIGAAETFASGPPTRALERAYFNGSSLLSREGSYDVGPNGRFLMLKQVETPGPASEPATLVVVKNWSSELKRRVPPPR
jgi:serine/threonine-protein kinase